MSISPSVFSCCTGTALPLIKARERPSALMTRRSRHWSSSSSACSSSQSRARGRPDTSNSALNSARFAPLRTSLPLPRSPRTSPSASTRMDLPAPVSPVRTVMPGSNSTSMRSTIAKSRTCSVTSTVSCLPPARPACANRVPSAAWSAGCRRSRTPAGAAGSGVSRRQIPVACPAAGSRPWSVRPP